MTIRPSTLATSACAFSLLALSASLAQAQAHPSSA